MICAAHYTQVAPTKRVLAANRANSLAETSGPERGTDARAYCLDAGMPEEINILEERTAVAASVEGKMDTSGI